MGLCLVIAQVELNRVMSNGLALVMLKCTLIHACCYNNLIIDLFWPCVQLYDVHVDLTRLSVDWSCDLHAYDLMNMSCWLVWSSLMCIGLSKCKIACFNEMSLFSMISWYVHIVSYLVQVVY